MVRFPPFKLFIIAATIAAAAVVVMVVITNTHTAFGGTDEGSSNRLINSSSPYLLQHAHNPVDWYPWGNEAFTRARRENKPLLISIGYSTCYWCHVMEREVFENPEIARLMNESIVSVKVDREQRPDIDEIYMTATQLITGGGGWPNNVFVTPDLKPFFAGTYIPPQRFVPLIERIGEQWRQDAGVIKRDAYTIADAIISTKQQENSAAAGSLPDARAVAALLSHFRDYYDNGFGGFYQAPKFPNETVLLFLLELHRLTGDDVALDMARGSLEKMSEGGIHDHVGGGFHRYSTDKYWHIPHFEKMLYNQALLGLAYTELYMFSPTPANLTVAEGIFDFTLRRLTHADGGFYSALDAETDGVEGAYYSWTDRQLQDVLDDDSYAWLMQHYSLADIPDIPGHKNSEGKVLYLRQPLDDAAVVRRNSEAMAALRKHRNKRKLPRLDDKIITAWNGLMIDAFARGGVVMKRTDYILAARRGADFILANLRGNDGKLWRSWREGKAEISGYFEDYAFMVQGLISTYRASGEEKYLLAAQELAHSAKELFWDDKSDGYYFTDGNEKLLVRMKNAADSALPSGNAVMANVLVDMYEITGDAQWQQQAEDIIRAFGEAIGENPRAYTHLVQALLRLEHISVADKNDVVSAGGDRSVDTSESKAWVDVKVKSQREGGERVIFTAILDIASGWHVNANPATMDFLIPTSVDIRADGGEVRLENTGYPQGKALNTPLGDIKVYMGKVEIPVAVTLPDKVKNLRLLLRAQACKGNVCLAPSDWVLPLNIP